MQFQKNMKSYVSRSLAYNPAGKFLILFVNPTVNRDTGAILALQFFKLMLETYSAAHVIFTFGLGISKYDIYATDPYINAKECGKIFIFIF